MKKQKSPTKALTQPQTAPPARTPEGRFPAGVSGNPSGRPLGKRNQVTDLSLDLELAIRRGISSQRITNIVERLIIQAEQGSIQAARLILDKVLPNAVAASDEENTAPALTIRIENATFAGTKSAGELSPVVRVIDNETEKDLHVVPKNVSDMQRGKAS